MTLKKMKQTEKTVSHPVNFSPKGEVAFRLLLQKPLLQFARLIHPIAQLLTAGKEGKAITTIRKKVKKLVRSPL
jgi:hypothetical protein